MRILVGSLAALLLSLSTTAAFALTTIPKGTQTVYIFPNARSANVPEIATAVHCVCTTPDPKGTIYPQSWTVEFYDNNGSVASVLSASCVAADRPRTVATKATEVFTEENVGASPVLDPGFVRVIAPKVIAKGLLCEAQVVDSTGTDLTTNYSLHGIRKGSPSLPKDVFSP